MCNTMLSRNTSSVGSVTLPTEACTEVLHRTPVTEDMKHDLGMKEIAVPNRLTASDMGSVTQQRLLSGLCLKEQERTRTVPRWKTP